MLQTDIKQKSENGIRISRIGDPVLFRQFVKPWTEFNFILQHLKFLCTLLPTTLRKLSSILSSAHCTPYSSSVTDKNCLWIGPLRRI